MAVGVEGRKVRYAVVGAGWISQAAFMPGVAPSGNSEIGAVVTSDPEKARALSRRYGGVPTFTYDEFPKMIADRVVDAVYLATPNDRHREFAVPALEAGLHLLLEKPTATSVEDAEAITAAAKRGGARLMIAYRLHCEPATLAALEAIEAGRIGTPRLFSSVFTQFVSPDNHRAKGGFWAGPVPDMGTYPLNAVRNLFRAEPVRVSATGVDAQGFGFADTVSVTLVFPDDRIAQFTVAYGPASCNEFRVVGSEGELHMIPAFGFGEGVALGFDLTRKDEDRRHAFPEVDQFAGETQYFSECILDGREPEPDGEEGEADIRVLCAIERALRSGGVEQLEPRPWRQRARPTARTLGPTRPPELVNAAEPGG